MDLEHVPQGIDSILPIHSFIHSFIPSLSLSSMALNIDLIYQFIRVFQYQVPVYTGNYGYGTGTVQVR